MKSPSPSIVERFGMRIGPLQIQAGCLWPQTSLGASINFLPDHSGSLQIAVLVLFLSFQWIAKEARQQR